MPSSESESPSTNETQDLGSLSFADYQAVRRGEAPAEQKAKSATDLKSGQNESPESDTEENEAEDQSDESQDESEELESKESEDKPKRKSGYQRRVDKLNARISAERQRAEDLERRLAQLEQGSQSKAKADSTPAAADDKPNPENFDTHAEYVEALTDWKITQKEKIQAQKAREESLKSEQEKALKAHVSRVESFKKTMSDFEEVLEAVDDVRVSQAVQQAIIESENGPALMYELAKNRAEYERINSLSPLAAAREMGRLEAKVAASTEKAPETKKVTSAPKPLAPVGKGKGVVAKSISDPDLSFSEYERLRREQIKRRRG